MSCNEQITWLSAALGIVVGCLVLALIALMIPPRHDKGQTSPKRSLYLSASMGYLLGTLVVITMMTRHPVTVHLIGICILPSLIVIPLSVESYLWLKRR